MVSRDAFLASLALLLSACSAGSEATSAVVAPAATVVEVPAVVTPDADAGARPGEGLRLVYHVLPATEEAAEDALQRARERLDKMALPLQLALHREGLAVVLELGPCDEAEARAVKAAMVEQGGLTVARLADDADPLAPLRALAPPPGIEVDTESVSAGAATTSPVVYAHIDPSTNRRKASQRLLDWVRANTRGVERLVVGASTSDGRQRLRTYVLAEEPQFLDVSDAIVVDDGSSAVEVSLTTAGSSVFARSTRDNIRRRLALLLDGEVLIAPTVQERISGGRLRITLGASADPAREAGELAQRLRLGLSGPALELAREEVFGD